MNGRHLVVLHERRSAVQVETRPANYIGGRSTRSLANRHPGWILTPKGGELSCRVACWSGHLGPTHTPQISLRMWERASDARCARARARARSQRARLRLLQQAGNGRLPVVARFVRQPRQLHVPALTAPRTRWSASSTCTTPSYPWATALTSAAHLPPGTVGSKRPSSRVDRKALLLAQH